MTILFAAVHEFRYWHQTDVAFVITEVRCWG